MVDFDEEWQAELERRRLEEERRRREEERKRQIGQARQIARQYGGYDERAMLRGAGKQITKGLGRLGIKIGGRAAAGAGAPAVGGAAAVGGGALATVLPWIILVLVIVLLIALLFFLLIFTATYLCSGEAGLSVQLFVTQLSVPGLGSICQFAVPGLFGVGAGGGQNISAEGDQCPNVPKPPRVVKAECVGCVDLKTIPGLRIKNNSLAKPESHEIIKRLANNPLVRDKFWVTEAFCPTVLHRSIDHYNGYAIDINLREEYRNGELPKNLQDLIDLFNALKTAGQFSELICEYPPSVWSQCVGTAGTAAHIHFSPLPGFGLP